MTKVKKNHVLQSLSMFVQVTRANKLLRDNANKGGVFPQCELSHGLAGVVFVKTIWDTVNICMVSLLNELPSVFSGPEEKYKF